MDKHAQLGGWVGGCAGTRVVMSQGTIKSYATVALRERPDMSDGMKIKRAKHGS